MQAAALSNLKPVFLELGGKSPFIIFDDADIDEAAALAFQGVVFNKAKPLLFDLFLKQNTSTSSITKCPAFFFFGTG